MNELIASPFLDEYLVLRPGSTQGLKIPLHRYSRLRQAAAGGEVCPGWLSDPVQRLWGLDIVGWPVS